MNATTEQIERANKKVAMGCKLPFERILELVVKEDLRTAPRQMTKKELAKHQSRKNVENGTSNVIDMGEFNRANAMKNLPSWMR